MLNLKDVALCAISSVHRELTVRALECSARQVRFGDALFFSDTPVENSHFRFQPIDPIRSKLDYSNFVLRDLERRVSAPYVLIVQWDGYVRDPSAWTDEFFEWDYIGARWPWHMDGKAVGNGGFSLRSSKLLKAVIALDAAPINLDGKQEAEDDTICRRLRARLEQEQGIRFAPDWLADRFSYEWTNPERSTFGFHGLRSFWREVPDPEFAQIAPLLQPMAGDSGVDPFFLECLVETARQRRHKPFAALYQRLRRQMSADEAYRAIATFSRDLDLALLCTRMGERQGPFDAL